MPHDDSGGTDPKRAEAGVVIDPGFSMHTRLLGHDRCGLGRTPSTMTFLDRQVGYSFHILRGGQYVEKLFYIKSYKLSTRQKGRWKLCRRKSPLANEATRQNLGRLGWRYLHCFGFMNPKVYAYISSMNALVVEIRRSVLFSKSQSWPLFLSPSPH